jgi:DNA-binding MarR family transcriptional regulator
MRFVPDNGISVRKLKRLTGATVKERRFWLIRMSRWGYVVLKSDAEKSPSKADWMVRPTDGGLKALDAWRPLTGIIEKRWHERFGKDVDVIAQLRESLQAVVDKLPGSLPDHLPILGYELLSQAPEHESSVPAEVAAAPFSNSTMPALLAKVLLAFAIEFERDSGLSLAISANVLRLVGQDGVRVRDLPRLSGVSKEAIAMALGRLEERGLATIQPEASGSRVRILVLTPQGRRAQNTYHQLVREIEQRWQATFGKDPIRNLRKLLERVVGDPSAKISPLFRGLEPYPDGWRASVPKPEVLPYYPMVLHRGGFPDGS